MSQELSDKEKQLLQAQHARGPTCMSGTSKPDHLQLQVMSTTAGSILGFRISEVKSSPSPKGDTQPPASSSSPPGKGPGPHGDAWVPVSQLCPLERGPLSPACKSRPRESELLLTVTGSTAASPASELSVSKVSP